MTAFTDEVREIVSPHKFGGSRRAAAAWLISLNGFEDKQTGTSEAPCLWNALIGRTIVSEDDRGFVYAQRFPTVAAARETFQAIEEDYSAWCGEEDSC